MTVEKKNGKAGEHIIAHFLYYYIRISIINYHKLLESMRLSSNNTVRM